MKKLFSAVLISLCASAAPAGSALAQGALQTRTASGVVTRFQAREKVLEIETADGTRMRFLWTRETKFNGTVSPRAKVAVRYTVREGENLAQTVGVESEGK